MTLEEGLE